MGEKGATDWLGSRISPAYAVNLMIFTKKESANPQNCPFKPPATGPGDISEWGGWIYTTENIRAEHIIESIQKPLYEFLGPGKSLADIGAGVGQLKVALDRINADIDYTGFDGGANIMEMEGVHAPVANDDHHIIPKLCWVDASKPFDIHRTFDAVLSKEVGEHIPKEGEGAFMDNLVRLAQPNGGRIILTWAHPGQGGHGHVNEQPKEYIIEQMEKRGVRFEKGATDWLGSRISPAYAVNLMIFTKKESANPQNCPFKPPATGPGDISEWGGWIYTTENIRAEHIIESIQKPLYEFLGPGKSLVDIGAGVGQLKVALDRINADIDYTGFDGGANIMEM